MKSFSSVTLNKNTPVASIKTQISAFSTLKYASDLHFYTEICGSLRLLLQKT